MDKRRQLVLSSSLASLVAPTIFTVYTVSNGASGPWVGTNFVVAWVVTVLHLLLLGLPILAVLHSWGKSGWLAQSAAGFVAGVLPVGVLTSPLLSVGAVSANDWVNYLAWCLPSGLLGTVTAIAQRAGCLAMDRRLARPA